MLKHKKFLSLLLVLPFLSITSCSKPKEKYKVENDYEGIVVTPNTFDPIKDGERLPVENLVVTFNGTNLTWLGEGNKEYENETVFFLATNAKYPTNSIVTNPKVTTNVEKSVLSFYVAHYENETVYVSTKLKVTITNSNALKPWVWYVVTAVVIFGVIGMVFLTRHYKAKKEGKI